MKEAIQKIIHHYIEYEPETNTTVFDFNKDRFDEILMACNTGGFFSRYRAIIVEHSDFLGSKGSDELIREPLTNYMKNENPDTILIFTYEGDKLDARKKLVKAIKKQAGSKNIRHFGLLNDIERRNTVDDYCRNYHMTMSRDALQEFYHRTGYSYSSIIQELEKLRIYGERIEADDVKALTTRCLEDNVFDLFHMLIQQKNDQAYRMWKDFEMQGNDPIQLIALLAAQYRFLDQVLSLYENGMSEREIADTLNAHPYRVQKTLEDAYDVSEQEVAKTLNELAMLDQDIKAGKMDKKLGFELFLIRKNTWNH